MESQKIYGYMRVSKKEKGVDIKGDILQITASILTIVGALIAIYVVSLSNTENIADIENPNI